MATAVTLAQAAGQSYDNLHIRWVANALKNALLTFCDTTLPQFPDTASQSRPVSNWIAVIWALGTKMPATSVPMDQLNLAAQYVYRLCWMADTLLTAGLITNDQATFLLQSYNIIIGF
jgi:hypothetical protein